MSKFVELLQLAQFLPFWKDQGRDKNKVRGLVLPFCRLEASLLARRLMM